MLKINKLLAFCILIFTIVVSSCGGGSGNSNPGDTSSGTGTINACETTGISHVFTSNIALSSDSAKNVAIKADAEETLVSSVLSFIGTGGISEPVIFTTSTGKDVILTITKLKQIKEGFISIVFDAIIEVEINTEGITEIQRNSVSGKKAIIDIATGKFYDLSGYDIDNTIIDENNLYITKEGTVYKISFSDITIATPLNNATYNRVGKLLFKTNNNKIVTNYQYSSGTNGTANYLIDIACVIPPKVIQSTTVTANFRWADEDYEINIADTYVPVMIDENGNIWSYEIDWMRTGGPSVDGTIAVFQISVDDNGQTVVSNYSEQQLAFTCGNQSSYDVHIKNIDNYNERLYIAENGFVYIRLKTGGGLEIASSSFTRPSEFTNPDNCPTVKNGYIYWIKDTSIKRSELVTGNTIETVFSNSNVVNPVILNGYITMSIVGSNIIFYQYITALNVGTYNLQIGSSTPVLISENKAEILNIIELTF